MVAIADQFAKWLDINLPANPSHKTPKLQHYIAIFPPTTIHETYGVVTIIDDKLAIICCTKAIDHQYPPPKFIFPQTQPEPPWKPHDTRYIDMSLEDKARFHIGGIDTFVRGSIPREQIDDLSCKSRLSIFEHEDT
ncbi:hypothetical protein Tco_1269855, partial [Tanacetum coccineum]